MKVTYLKEEKIPMIQAENAFGLKVTFCNIGASIYSIIYNNELMTLTPKSPRDFLKPTIYYGKTIGGIANRVKDGKITIDDKEYQLLLNEGNNALHGGKYALSDCIFRSKINFGNNFFTILYTFKKKKMIDGLPGTITYYITYCLNDMSNELLADMKAISNDKTIISLTNHSYFCLGNDSIEGLYLTLPASKYVLPNPVDLTPGEEKEVNKVMDFRKKKLITRDINDKDIQASKTKGYDHHFIFDNDKEPVILENSKYKLEIKTDFPGCQIYTDNYPDDIAMKSTDKPCLRGVAIEPQDSPLERKTVLKGQIYHHQITYSFSKKD